MNAIVVDDERLAVENLVGKLQGIGRIREARGFTDADEALAFARENEVDVAFLDIQMPQMHGLILAEKLRALRPGCAVLFVTGYAEYAVDAYRMHAEGYLMKPVTVEHIERELGHLRRESPLARRSGGKRVRVQTFGNFEVYVDGEPLRFSRSKAKEVFAYLIHKRGSACTVKELAAALFEDMPYDKKQLGYMQVILRSMTDAFQAVGADEVLQKSHNSFAVNTDEVDCDYFRFNALEPAAFNAYTGEYMSQYSWAELTAAYLDAKQPPASSPAPWLSRRSKKGAK